MLPALRDYQELVARRLRASFSPSFPAICQMPTGSGKTLLAAHLLVEHAATHPDASMVWVTHRDVLADQTQHALTQSGLPTISWRNGASRARGNWQAGAVHIVSDRWKNLPAMPTQPGLLVYDEAHHAVSQRMGTRWIDEWQDAGGVCLGLTATPWRMSKTQGLDPPWKQLVPGPTIADLQRSDWLANVSVRLPPHMSQVVDRRRLKTSVSDFVMSSAEAEVLRLLEQTAAVDYALEHLRERHCYRTMWFVPTVEAAYALMPLLSDRGQSAVVLTGKTPSSERSDVVRGFTSGSTPHLVSVDVLLEGLDVPQCDSLVVLRPTKSRSVHYQMFGRAMRPHDAGVNGGRVLALDLAGNTQTLGLVGDPRHEWTLAPRSHSTADEDTPAMPCVDCRSLIAAGHHTCPECGAPQGRVCRDERGTPSGCQRWCHHKHFNRSTRVCDECVETHQTMQRKQQTTTWYADGLPIRLLDVERHAARSTQQKVLRRKTRITDDAMTEAAQDTAHLRPRWGRAHSTGNVWTRLCPPGGSSEVRLTLKEKADNPHQTVVLGYTSKTPHDGGVCAFAVPIDHNEVEPKLVASACVTGYLAAVRAD